MRFLMRSLMVLIFLLNGPFAYSATLKNTKVGNWLVGAYSNDQTRQFSHCGAITSYNSGIRMLFGVARNYAWSLGFANPQWNLSGGSTYSIAFTVDNIPALRAVAYAIGPQQVKVDLADSEALFNVFRHGKLLTVYAAGQTFQFNLLSTSRLLPVLLNCVHNYMDPRQEAPHNPFIAASKPVEQAMPALSSPPVPAAPATPMQANVASVESKEAKDQLVLARQVEATSLLANILGQAGVTSFQILKPSEAAQFKADAAWRAGDSFGTLTILTGDNKSPVSDLSAILMASDAKNCSGKFVSGSMPDETGKEGSRIMTSCQTGDKNLTAYYSIFSRSEGGHYVLSTAGSEKPSVGAPKQTEGIDNGVRTAAYKVLQK